MRIHFNPFRITGTARRALVLTLIPFLASQPTWAGNGWSVTVSVDDHGASIHWGTPNDPPALADVPDIPSPDFELPDPFDDLPYPGDDPWQDPWDLPDPFDDPDPWDDIPPVSDDIGNCPQFSLSEYCMATGDQVGYSPVEYTMEPLMLPFRPSFAGATLRPRAKKACNPAADTRFFTPGLNPSVGVIGTCPLRVIRNIRIDFIPGAIKADPSGSQLLVSSGNNLMELIDAKTYAATRVVLPPGVATGSIAWSADSTTAYIADHSQNGRLIVLDVATKTVKQFMLTGSFPTALTLTPDGTMLWVSCRGDNTVRVYDTLTNLPAGQITRTRPLGIAFDPAGTKAYIAAAPDFGNGTIEVVDVTTLDKIASIPVGQLPYHVLMSPTGRHLFVNHAGSSFISWIDPVTNTVLRNQPTRHPTWGIGFIRR
jgi:YVTN family beta-propeller protein